MAFKHLTPNKRMKQPSKEAVKVSRKSNIKQIILYALKGIREYYVETQPSPSAYAGAAGLNERDSSP
jgi:hypothetical protein